MLVALLRILQLASPRHQFVDQKPLSVPPHETRDQRGPLLWAPRVQVLHEQGDDRVD